MDVPKSERSHLDWAGNIAALAVVIVVNALANIIPIGGQNTGEVSANYPSLFTPAGFTFSIWGLIYLALAAFVIYQALPGQRDSDLMARISRPFKINCFANAAWIFAWHYNQVVLSLVIMFVILGSLVVIYQRITAARPPIWSPLWFLVSVPFSLYVGWITVATLANLSIWQMVAGWESAGLSEVNWTLVKLGIAGFLACLVGIRRKDFVYVWVITWAAFGIAVAQAAFPEVEGGAMVVYFTTLFIGVWLLGERLTSRHREFRVQP